MWDDNVDPEVYQEKTKEISTLVNEAERLIREAETIAQEYQIPFGFDVAYGMGGWFGRASGWNYDSNEQPDENGRYEYRWNASSQSC